MQYHEELDIAESFSEEFTISMLLESSCCPYFIVFFISFLHWFNCIFLTGLLNFACVNIIKWEGFLCTCVYLAFRVFAPCLPLWGISLYQVFSFIYQHVWGCSFVRVSTFVGIEGRMYWNSVICLLNFVYQNNKGSLQLFCKEQTCLYFKAMPISISITNSLCIQSNLVCLFHCCSDELWFSNLYHTIMPFHDGLFVYLICFGELQIIDKQLDPMYHYSLSFFSLLKWKRPCIHRMKLLLPAARSITSVQNFPGNLQEVSSLFTIQTNTFTRNNWK